MKVRLRDQLGMLPNTMWEAAYLANECARKLAHLKVFIAFQTEKASLDGYV